MLGLLQLRQNLAPNPERNPLLTNWGPCTQIWRCWFSSQLRTVAEFCSHPEEVRLTDSDANQTLAPLKTKRYRPSISYSRNNFKQLHLPHLLYLQCNIKNVTKHSLYLIFEHLLFLTGYLQNSHIFSLVFLLIIEVFEKLREVLTYPVLSSILASLNHEKGNVLRIFPDNLILFLLYFSRQFLLKIKNCLCFVSFAQVLSIELCAAILYQMNKKLKTPQVVSSSEAKMGNYRCLIETHDGRFVIFF